MEHRVLVNRARQAALENRTLIPGPEPRPRTGLQTVAPPPGKVSTKKSPCGGCQKRKEWLNKIIPGSGDLVEKITEVTGIKALVESRVTESETDTSDIPERHRPEFDGPRTSESRPSQGFGS